MKTIIMTSESNKKKTLFTLINGVLMPLVNGLDYDKK